MKITLKTPTPRNRFALAACKRQAGSHRPSASSHRQRLARELRAELADRRSP